MTILYLDFETYYDSDYSLTKMAPPNYILDSRFETIGCAVRREGEGASQFIDGPDLPAYLAGLDPATTTTVAFNALFDNCILAWRYNFVPARIVCTMRMAVALLGHVLQRHSLSEVGRSLGVGTKGSAIENARGKRRADLMGDPYQWRAYREYACNDNDMNRGIFIKLFPEFPQAERRIMDRVMRCAVVPKFVIDTKMLQAHLDELDRLQNEMLIEAGAPTTMDAPDRDDKLEEFSKTLRSNVKFEQILLGRGVEIEYKTSHTDPDRRIPAFAKTDEFMAKLQNHEDPEVQALTAARLGLRSTIEATRGQRMLDIARLDWPAYCDGNMPVPLKYAAAHTHRLGGDWQLNMQNLPSGRGGKVSKLRKALCAPPGYKVVVADKSQIECRINAYICGQDNLLNAFYEKADPYALLATSVFGYPVDKNSHPVERFIGKTGVLGLGYGCGPDRFYAMVIAAARMLGLDMGVLLQMWTTQLALRTVATYRRLNHNIMGRWQWLDAVLNSIWASGAKTHADFGPVRIGCGWVEGPGGLRMCYDSPRVDPDTGDMMYSYGGRNHHIYGAKLLENIVQFLARINTMHDALRISDRGFPFVLQSHDELVWIVPDAQVEKCKAVALEEMCRAPGWAPALPLAAECSHGQSYGDAK